MKLNKAIEDTTPELSMEELLQMENEFLRNELDFKDTMRSIELMETVLGCIDQEGSVSKSLEIMFGETVEDMSSFKEKLESEYNKSLESFLSDLKEKFLFGKDNFKRMVDHLKDLIKRAKNNISKITGSKFPMTVKLPRIFKDDAYGKDFLKSISEMIEDGIKAREPVGDPKQYSALNEIRGAFFTKSSNNQYKELLSAIKSDVDVTFDSAKDLFTEADDFCENYYKFKSRIEEQMKTIKSNRNDKLIMRFGVLLRLVERRTHNSMMSLMNTVNSVLK